MRCGSKHDLQFDHIDPADKKYESHKLEFSWRISVYRAEARAGKLQLLCAFHNRLKGNRHTR